MKRAILRRRQCSMMVILVMLTAALLPEVWVNAAPRGADEAARGPGKNAAEVTRLVTGDLVQINDVIAGIPPTAILAVNPVPVPAGVTPPNPYPPGTLIVGNELRAEVGGFRAWFNVQLSNWDPRADGPNAKAYQVRIDPTGYQDSDLPGNQPDLAHAVVPCITEAECVAAFGEGWAKCGVGFCRAGYVDRLGTGRPDSWCAPDGGGCIVGDASTIGEPNFFSVAGAATGRPDGGIVYYGGTLVLDIPAAARGKYTVNLNRDETFIASTFPDDIATFAETGFVVNIVTGQCCFGFGTPDEGCIDGVLPSECGDDEPPPFVFIPDGLCPPQGPECSSYFGACCDTLNGSCQDSVLQADCRGTHRVWTSGTSCGDAACIADTGVCCDHDPFGPCTDDTVLSDCQCATCTWHKLQACEEIDCDPTPIPTVSEWGLAILTLLLLTAAKLYFGRRAGEPRFVTPHRDH